MLSTECNEDKTTDFMQRKILYKSLVTTNTKHKLNGLKITQGIGMKGLI